MAASNAPWTRILPLGWNYQQRQPQWQSYPLGHFSLATDALDNNAPTLQAKSLRQAAQLVGLPPELGDASGFTNFVNDPESEPRFGTTTRFLPQPSQPPVRTQPPQQETPEGGKTPSSLLQTSSTTNALTVDNTDISASSTGAETKQGYSESTQRNVSQGDDKAKDTQYTADKLLSPLQRKPLGQYQPLGFNWPVINEPEPSDQPGQSIRFPQRDASPTQPSLGPTDNSDSSPNLSTRSAPFPEASPSFTQATNIPIPEAGDPSDAPTHIQRRNNTTPASEPDISAAQVSSPLAEITLADSAPEAVLQQNPSAVTTETIPEADIIGTDPGVAVPLPDIEQFSRQSFDNATEEATLADTALLGPLNLSTDITETPTADGSAEPLTIQPTLDPSAASPVSPLSEADRSTTISQIASTGSDATENAAAISARTEVSSELVSSSTSELSQRDAAPTSLYLTETTARDESDVVHPKPVQPEPDLTTQPADPLTARVTPQPLPAKEPTPSSIPQDVLSDDLSDRNSDAVVPIRDRSLTSPSKPIQKLGSEPPATHPPPLAETPDLSPAPHLIQPQVELRAEPLSIVPSTDEQTPAKQPSDQLTPSLSEEITLGTETVQTGLQSTESDFSKQTTQKSVLDSLPVVQTKPGPQSKLSFQSEPLQSESSQPSMVESVDSLAKLSAQYPKPLQLSPIQLKSLSDAATQPLGMHNQRLDELTDASSVTAQDIPTIQARYPQIKQPRLPSQKLTALAANYGLDSPSDNVLSTATSLLDESTLVSEPVTEADVIGDTADAAQTVSLKVPETVVEIAERGTAAQLSSGETEDQVLWQLAHILYSELRHDPRVRSHLTSSTFQQASPGLMPVTAVENKQPCLPLALWPPPLHQLAARVRRQLQARLRQDFERSAR